MEQDPSLSVSTFKQPASVTPRQDNATSPTETLNIPSKVTIGVEDAAIKYGLQQTPELKGQLEHYVTLGMDADKAGRLVKLDATFQPTFNAALKKLTGNFMAGTKAMFKVINDAWKSLENVRNSSFSGTEEGIALIQKRNEELEKAIDAYTNTLKEKTQNKEHFEVLSTIGSSGLSVLVACLPFCTNNEKALAGVAVSAHEIERLLGMAGIVFSEIAAITANAEDLLIEIYKSPHVKGGLKTEAYEALEFFYNYYRLKANSDNVDTANTTIALQKEVKIGDVLGMTKPEIHKLTAKDHKNVGTEEEKFMAKGIRALSKVEPVVVATS